MWWLAKKVIWRVVTIGSVALNGIATSNESAGQWLFRW